MLGGVGEKMTPRTPTKEAKKVGDQITDRHVPEKEKCAGVGFDRERGGKNEVTFCPQGNRWVGMRGYSKQDLQGRGGGLEGERENRLRRKRQFVK